MNQEQDIIDAFNSKYKNETYFRCDLGGVAGALVFVGYAIVVAARLIALAITRK